MGEKLPEPDRMQITDRIEAVRAALAGTDAGAVDSTKQQLAEVLQRIGSRAYASPAGGPGDGDGSDGSGPAESGAAEEEVETIEGEYKEV